MTEEYVYKTNIECPSCQSTEHRQDNSTVNTRVYYQYRGQLDLTRLIDLFPDVLKVRGICIDCKYVWTR